MNIICFERTAWYYKEVLGALPQLDRGADYESERQGFESLMPHHLNLHVAHISGVFCIHQVCSL